MIKRAQDGTHYSPHAPGAELDYGVNWSNWLDADETIATSEWTAPDGITLSRQQVSSGEKVASTFAAGGVAGSSYVLTNKITTSAGRKDSRTIKLVCEAR